MCPSHSLPHVMVSVSCLLLLGTKAWGLQNWGAGEHDCCELQAQHWGACPPPPSDEGVVVKVALQKSLEFC